MTNVAIRPEAVTPPAAPKVKRRSVNFPVYNMDPPIITCLKKSVHEMLDDLG